MHIKKRKKKTYNKDKKNRNYIHTPILFSLDNNKDKYIDSDVLIFNVYYKNDKKYYKQEVCVNYESLDEDTIINNLHVFLDEFLSENSIFKDIEYFSIKLKECLTQKSIYSFLTNVEFLEKQEIPVYFLIDSPDENIFLLDSKTKSIKFTQ